jgi:hypothetical protein
MSSILRAPSQIPVRTKYFLVVASDVSANEAADSPAFTLDGHWPVTVGTIAMPASHVNDNATAQPVTAGALYRDMGRQIIVADEDGVHLAHYRAAQLVNGAESEGVEGPPFSEIYLRVWGADGANVQVVRTG